MDNDNKLLNSRDDVYTNCFWFCLLKSNKKRPIKIEEKMYVLPLKNPYCPNPNKNIQEGFKIFCKGV